MPKALECYLLEKVSKISLQALQSYTEVIDEESKEVYETTLKNTPQRTGGLKASLRIERKLGNNRYGYRIYYDGYNENGIAYDKIANTLNKGTSTIRATRHIRRAVRKLKGIDHRIYARYLKKIKSV